MNIYVLVKRTFDTEERILITNGEVQEDGAEFIINPYDEYGIEEAIRLREKHGGEVTAISVGTDEVEKQLRTALAMGVDKAVLINAEEDIVDGDQFTTATIITKYLKDKDVDIILAGNVAIDGGSGQVGPQVAEGLGIPYVTTITKIDVNGSEVSITRDVEGDSEIIQTSLPVLVTCQQGLNEPRYPSLPGIMQARRKPLEEVELDDLDLNIEDVEAKTKTLDIYLPPQKSAGRLLEGEIPAQVEELVRLLNSEAKVI